MQAGVATHAPTNHKRARVKRIAAWGQTLHHTPAGPPACTGPTQHLPTHSRMHGKCRRGHWQHNMHAADASPPTHRPITSARVSNESLPGGNTPLHARDPHNTCPPTPARTENAGAGIGSHRSDNTHAGAASPPMHLQITSARIKLISAWGNHSTTHVGSCTHGTHLTPRPHAHLLAPHPLRTRCLVLVPAAAASPPTPGRQLRTAHVKRITAPPQTFHQSSLHPRDTALACAENAGAGIGSHTQRPDHHAHLPNTNPEPIAVQQNQLCRRDNDTPLKLLQVCKKQTRGRA